MRYSVLFCLWYILSSTMVFSAESREPTQEQTASLLPHMVRVQFHLRYHQGDQPQSSIMTEQCPNCGRYHVNQASNAMREERPAELPGVMISASEVISLDPLLHPRFIEKITVRVGEQIHDAEISAFANDRAAIRITLAKPIEGIAPLHFVAPEDQTLSSLSYRPFEGEWSVLSSPFKPVKMWGNSGETTVSLPAPALIVTEKGQPVAITVQTLHAENEWSLSPWDWAWVEHDSLTSISDKMDATTGDSLVRVLLNFRAASHRGPLSAHPIHSDDSVTELWTAGIILENNQLLVLADLPPQMTARLERIRAYRDTLNDAQALEAFFVSSLKDYGALLARIDTDVEGLKLSKLNPLAVRNRLLPSTDFSIVGNQSVAWPHYTRISNLSRGWRSQIVPELRGSGDSTYVLDESGALLLFPVSRRDRSASQSSMRFSRTRSNAQPVFSRYIHTVIEALETHGDPSNIPLSEEDQGRIAWLGVDLQRLTDEMAAQAALSSVHGRSGAALITYVYPDSPADKLGLTSGMILRGVRIPGHSQPLRVEADEDPFGGRPFPWDQLDHVPAEHFDMIPNPWPSVASSLNLSLTNLGFGTEVVLELFHEGNHFEHNLVIDQAPAYYDIAPRHRSEALGMTVRNLTFETRRFFRRPEPEPGIIVSAIDGGKSAATAGLRPFEIITHVNDTPIHNVAEWEQSLQSNQELRLSVRRMQRGRVVALTQPTPKD